MRPFFTLACLFTFCALSAQHHVRPPSSDQPDTSKALDVKHQLRGHFYASSPYDMKFAGYGGWGGSSNEFHPIDGAPSSEEEIGVLADPSDSCAFWNISLGMKVFLFNASEDTLFFEAQDSRLYMHIQAKNAKGKWQDIEYLPSSWCGNSYHFVYLPPESYWEFEAPVFTGSMDTELRIVATCLKEFGSTKTRTLISPPYAGKINPEQFTNKEAYQPSGIMDPYNE